MELGELQENYVVPTLQNLLGAKYVSVKPLSGMTALLIGLAGLVPSGSTILILSPELGGHFCTEHIARRLGLEIRHIPFSHSVQLDVESLKNIIQEVNPSLVYWDQSNVLFPESPKEISKIIKGINSEIILYYDVSHLLGFVISGIFENPLNCGFDIIGGSTHKSFPGPQKGLIATNSVDYFSKIQEYADIFISHPQMAHLVSLALTLNHYENSSLKDEIANSVIIARKFGQYCSDHGLDVFGSDRHYTNTHQLWVRLPDVSIPALANRLTASGIYTNCFENFAPVGGKCCRLGFNEIARFGISDDDLKQISYYFACAINASETSEFLSQKVSEIREKYHLESFELFNENVKKMILCLQ